VEAVAAKEGLMEGDYIGGSVSLGWESCHIAAGHFFGHEANHVDQRGVTSTADPSSADLPHLSKMIRISFTSYKQQMP